MAPSPRTLAYTFGAVLFALMTFTVLVMGLIFSQYTIAALIVGITFGALTVFLARGAYSTFRDENRHRVPTGLGQEHSRLLKLAAHQQGRLTAEEAAIECRVSVQQAEQLLNDLVLQGRADTWVSDSGAMVYVFQGLLEGEKDTAEDPMKMLGP